MNAADPASPAGLDIGGLNRKFPPRTANARLCFRGADLIAISTKGGRELEIFVPPGSASEIIAFAGAPRTRLSHPSRKLSIETINGQGAAASPWADLFRAAGFIADRGRLLLW